jgi:predicted GIY-YIG superfamily endonuclease
MNRDFYVYVLKDEDGIIRYIGKTCNYKSRISDHFKKSSNPTIKNIINENWSHDHIIVTIDELEALKVERRLIKKYKNQLYNIKNYGGISGRISNKITLILKNIKTGEILNFKSQLEAANFLNVDKSTVSYLVKGKRKHISGTWTLVDTDIDDLIINPRKRGYIIDNPKNYFKLYDTHLKKYITYKSVTDCANKIKSDTTSVSMLRRGKLLSLIKGRYRLSKKSSSQYKKTKIIDLLTNTIKEYNTRAEFCKEYGISSSMASTLATGKCKMIYNRFKMVD